MLLDVKLRAYDSVRRCEVNEIVTVDAASGDEAAEAAQALRPGYLVIGVAPAGNFGEVGGAAFEGEDNPVDDEDAEPGPSKRELAAMQPRRGPGRPRKEPAA